MREAERQKQRAKLCVRNKLIRFLLLATILGLAAFAENSFETIFSLNTVSIRDI